MNIKRNIRREYTYQRDIKEELQDILRYPSGEGIAPRVGELVRLVM